MCHIDSFKLKSEPINHTTSYPSTVICSLQTGVEMAHCMPLQFQCGRIGCSQSPFVLQSMPGQQRCRCELPRTQKRLYMIRPKIAWNIVRKPGVGNPEFLHHRFFVIHFSVFQLLGHRQVDRCLLVQPIASWTCWKWAEPWYEMLHFYRKKRAQPQQSSDVDHGHGKYGLMMA